MKHAGAPALVATEVERQSGRPPLRHSGARARRTFANVAPFIPAAILGVTWLVGISASGGYYPEAWYPSALGAAVVLMVTAVLTGRLLRTSRAARTALLAFAGLVALNYLSMLWAGSPGDALQAANKLVLYLAVAWTFSILPWTPRAMVVLLGAFSLGITAFCAVGLVQATHASNLTPFFDQLRYATPLDYPNATAALAVMGMWPALILSSRHELPGWSRAALLAVAVFLTEFALLPQSRGALLGLVITAPLVLVFASGRIRLLIRMGVVAAGASVTLPRTLAVDDAVTAGRHVAPVLNHAANVMLETTAAALAVGAFLVLAEARLGRSFRLVGSRPRIGRRLHVALPVVALLAIAGAAVAVAPAAERFARSELHRGRTDAPTGSTRLFSATPEERFDYVRVTARLFVNSPVLGIGGGNFGRRYDALRRFPKHSQYTHDLPLRVASETGVVGFALFVTVVAALLVGLAKAGRELPGIGRACAVATLAVATYFLVHASLDWLDEFPVLAAPALSLPLAAIGMRKAKTRSELETPASARTARFASRRPGLAGGWVLALIVVADVALCLAVGAPYLAIRYTDRALATYTTHTAAAYRDLTRADALNPLSANGLITEGAIAINLEDATRARSAFLRALRLENDWFPHLELALLDAEAGQFSQALNELSSAKSLDASDPVLAQARNEIIGHHEPDPAGFNRLLLQGGSADVFRTEKIVK